MQPTESITTAQQLLDSLQELPIGVHAAALVGLIAGLSLWIAGRRIVKPVFLLLGLTLAAVGGFFAAPLFGTDTILGYPSPYIGLGVGAIFGLAASAFLFRFTMAIATGASLAVASCLGAAVYLNANPTPTQLETALADRGALATEDLALNRVPILNADDPTEQDHRFGEHPMPETQEGDEPSDVANVASNAAFRVRDFMGHLGAELGLIWKQLPVRDRKVITSAGLAGAFIGALLGLVMPKRASALFTALFGAAIWMPSLFWILTAIDAPIGFLGTLSAKSWLIVWAVISLVGAMTQWSGLATRKMRKMDEDDDDDDDD
jgi:hypothetical protein